MRIEFRDTRKALSLLSILDDLEIEQRGELEDILKKACVFRFVAEVEYYLIEIVFNEYIEERTKKNLRRKIIGELEYENIKKLFKRNFWQEVERLTLERIKEKEEAYINFNPRYDAPFDDIVRIRNDIAHSSDTREVIDIGTLKKTIDFMEELLNTLREKLQR